MRSSTPPTIRNRQFDYTDLRLMTRRRLLPILSLVLFLPLTSCGAGTGEDRPGSGDSTDVEGETYSSLFAEAMIELSHRMVEITASVQTVADADSAEGRVTAALDTLTVRIEYIVDNLDRLVAADPDGFRDPADLMELPEVVAATIPAEEAMLALEHNNPTAAIRLAYHAGEHSERVARLLDEIMLAYERRKEEE